MAQVVNGVPFPDDYTKEQIDDYFKKLEGNELPTEEKKEEEDERGILTDVPVQAVGGVADAGKSALRLIEGVGQDMKRKFNVGGFTFGDNAENGFVQYHTYDDVINNNIKLPVSGDPTKIGDSAFEELIPDIDDADTATGAVTRSISQFLSGWYLTKPA